jgi:F-type H+-transporting ATPase subunit b
MAQNKATTHETVEHAASHGGGEFPPFNAATYPGQLIWLALTFGFLYYMMAKLVVPRLSGLIEHRRVTIASDLDEAAGMRQRAEQAGAAYEASMNEARARAKAIAQETRDSLAAESEARRKALEADLNTRIAQSESTIRARTEEAMASVRGIAADTAAAIVERLTGRAPDPNVIATATNRTLSA